MSAVKSIFVGITPLLLECATKVFDNGEDKTYSEYSLHIFIL